MKEESRKSGGFQQLIEAACRETNVGVKKATAFLQGHCRAKRYVIGRNADAAALLRQVPVDGVIDDFTHECSWNGVRIIRMSDAEADGWVANCSTSISPVDVRRRLVESGIGTVIELHSLVRASQCTPGIDLQLPWFARQQQDDFREHSMEWADLYARLADDTSRKCLLDVLRYRLTAIPQYMTDYSVRLQDQYFESFMHLRSEVFVDAGGYDGGTTAEFCRRYPDYRKVYLFEPSERNMGKARVRLKGHRDIQFEQLGLSDCVGSLPFDGRAGSASSVSDDGNETISVTTLDTHVREPVSFIKMDLEGWEMKALSGCARHIRDHQPKLAISVYHSASDFRKVPGFILRIRPDYQLYLRHYTQGWSETVMFFVPTGPDRG